jgi:hypothetical protein
VTVAKDVKGGGELGWLGAKEMWFAGCQSLVQILRAKGRVRRWLTVGIMARPLGTAREPFCGWGRGVSFVSPMGVGGTDSEECEGGRGSLPVGRSLLGRLLLLTRV